MAIPQGEVRVSLSFEHSLRQLLLPYSEVWQALSSPAAPSAPMAATGRVPRKAAPRQHYLLQGWFKENVHLGHMEAVCNGRYRNKGVWSLGWHSAPTTPSYYNGDRAAWSDRYLGTSTSCRSARSQTLDAGSTALAGALFAPSEQTRVVRSGGLGVVPREMVAMPVIFSLGFQHLPEQGGVSFTSIAE